MKALIIIILLLLLLGCAKKVEPVVCDYKTFIDQNNNLMTQNIALQTDKSKCDIDLANSKNDNNALKLQMLNNVSNTVSCSSIVNRLNNCESNLEDCYNMNETIETEKCHNNETLLDMYDDCQDKLQEINNTLNYVQSAYAD